MQAATRVNAPRSPAIPTGTSIAPGPAPTAHVHCEYCTPGSRTRPRAAVECGRQRFPARWCAACRGTQRLRVSGFALRTSRRPPSRRRGVRAERSGAQYRCGRRRAGAQAAGDRPTRAGRRQRIQLGPEGLRCKAGAQTDGSDPPHLPTQQIYRSVSPPVLPPFGLAQWPERLFRSGISRKSGYKIFERYKEHGHEA
jgi:hypothetical protein